MELHKRAHKHLKSKTWAQLDIIFIESWKPENIRNHWFNFNPTCIASQSGSKATLQQLRHSSAAHASISVLGCSLWYKILLPPPPNSLEQTVPFQIVKDYFNMLAYRQCWCSLLWLHSSHMWLVRGLIRFPQGPRSGKNRTAVSVLDYPEGNLG